MDRIQGYPLAPQICWGLKIFILVACLPYGSLFAQTAQTTSASLKQLLETNTCTHCDLRYVDLTEKDLSGANLQSADLTGANLTLTNLRGANLSHAILINVQLIETKLSGANLRNANLSDLDIDEAFEWIEIIGTQLEGARFKDGVTCGPMPAKGGWGCQHLY